jgi:hypothetical protein
LYPILLSLKKTVVGGTFWHVYNQHFAQLHNKIIMIISSNDDSQHIKVRMSSYTFGLDFFGRVGTI